MAESLGCQLVKKGEKGSKVTGAQVVVPSMKRVMPRVMVSDTVALTISER